MYLQKKVLTFLLAVATTQLYAQVTVPNNTIAPTDYVGSANNQDVIFKANNIEYMRLLRTGLFGIGTSGPTSKLHVATTGTTQFQAERNSSGNQDNGFKLFFTSNPAAGIGVGGGSAIFQMTNPNNLSDLLFMPTPSSYSMVMKQAGNIGVGTLTPSSDTKFHVSGNYTSALPGPSYVREEGLFTSTTSQWGTFSGAAGMCNTTYAGGGGIYNGLYGSSTGDGVSSHGTSQGVFGTATGNYYNFGGSFEVFPTGNSVWNAAVFGETYGAAGAWAGYFNGPVYTSVSYTVSDQKFKDHVKPITGAMDKIRLLKPSTYTYKKDEFKYMSFPEGEQMGLIAQELEKVFPELIKEVPAREKLNERGEVVSSTPDFKSVNYLNLVPLLISAIQEQDNTMQAQQKQINEQKELINQLLQRSSNPTGIEDHSTLADFGMEQNNPNPFTDETVISYALPENVNVAYIAIYDLTGKQINSFPLNERGASSVTITSEKLNAGIYIYSIVADGKVLDSKRMIVANK